jgi:hypothetical protein
MHRRYEKDGLAVVSVSVDQPRDQGTALRFLRSQKAAFPNLHLTELSPAMERVFDFHSIPCVFVFDRSGRPHKFEGEFTFQDVERLAQEYLKQ